MRPGGNLSRTVPLGRNTPLRSVSTGRITPSRAEKFSAAGSLVPTTRSRATSGRAKSFPPGVAAQLAERDPWCVHCGSADGLQNHHRRLKGIGGDGRDHTQHACNGVRLCWLCHSWAHSGAGQNEARDEGLIVPRATLEPWTLDVLVHLEEDRGGMRKFPTCDGRWADEPEELAA